MDGVTGRCNGSRSQRDSVHWALVPGWQLAAIARGGWLVGARIQDNLPIAVGLFAPDGDVTSSGCHRIAIRIFAMTFKVPPGVADIS